MAPIMKIFLIVACVICSERVLSPQDIKLQQQIPMLECTINSQTKVFTLSFNFELSGQRFDSQNRSPIDVCGIETFFKRLKVKEKVEKRLFSKWKSLATISQRKSSVDEDLTLGITFNYKDEHVYHFMAFTLKTKEASDHIKKLEMLVNNQKIEVILLKVDRKFDKRFKKLVKNYLKRENKMECLPYKIY